MSSCPPSQTLQVNLIIDKIEMRRQDCGIRSCVEERFERVCDEAFESYIFEREFKKAYLNCENKQEYDSLMNFGCGTSAFQQRCKTLFKNKSKRYLDEIFNEGGDLLFKGKPVKWFFYDALTSKMREGCGDQTETLFLSTSESPKRIHRSNDGIEISYADPNVVIGFNEYFVELDSVPEIIVPRSKSKKDEFTVFVLLMLHDKGWFRYVKSLHILIYILFEY